jgi:hypothetical protein
MTPTYIGNVYIHIYACLGLIPTQFKVHINVESFSAGPAEVFAEPRNLA